MVTSLRKFCGRWNFLKEKETTYSLKQKCVANNVTRGIQTVHLQQDIV